MTAGNLSASSAMATGIVTRAIIERPDVLAEFAYEVIGPADRRTRSDEEAAERIAAFAAEYAGTRWMIERAPEIQALVLTRLIADVDWLQVVTAVTEAVRPRSRVNSATLWIRGLLSAL